MSGIAEEQANEVERGQMVDVTCAFCRSEGRIRTGAICQVCKGKGYRRLHEPTAPCASCRGTGRAKKRTTLTCVACGGLGTVEIDANADPVPCPDCGGSGRAVDCPGYPWPDSPLGCVRCRGTAVIDRAKLKPGESPPSGAGHGRRRRKAAGTSVRGITLEY